MYYFFGEISLVFEGGYKSITNDIVKEVGAGGARVAEVTDLNRCRSARQNADARMFRIPLEIDRNVDLKRLQASGYVKIRLGADVENVSNALTIRWRIGERSSGPNEMPIASNFLRSWISNNSAIKYAVACSWKSADR